MSWSVHPQSYYVHLVTVISAKSLVLANHYFPHRGRGNAATRFQATKWYNVYVHDNIIAAVTRKIEFIVQMLIFNQKRIERI